MATPSFIFRESNRPYYEKENKRETMKSQIVRCGRQYIRKNDDPSSHSLFFFYL